MSITQTIDANIDQISSHSSKRAVRHESEITGEKPKESKQSERWVEGQSIRIPATKVGHTPEALLISDKCFPQS